MPSHRRRRIGPFVSRSTYMALWQQYTELLASYRALENDHQSVLEDHEGLLYELEVPPGPEPVAAPEKGRHVPSWAETAEVPVITTAGLDPDKADALVRRTGLLDQPSGEWSLPPAENG